WITSFLRSINWQTLSRELSRAQVSVTSVHRPALLTSGTSTIWSALMRRARQYCNPRFTSGGRGARGTSSPDRGSSPGTLLGPEGSSHSILLGLHPLELLDRVLDAAGQARTWCRYRP